MQQSKILVAYATNAGTTADVAQMIGSELGVDGVQVEVRRLEEVTSLDPYTAVVVGAPMIMGWHKAATKFVKKHQQALSRLPVAYFFTAKSLTDTGVTDLGGIPIQIDPILAKPPRNAARLSFRERYATVTNYLPAGTPGCQVGQAHLSGLLWRQARALPVEMVAGALCDARHPGAAGRLAQ